MRHDNLLAIIAGMFCIAMALTIWVGPWRLGGYVIAVPIATAIVAVAMVALWLAVRFHGGG
jgi:hypothetical protein